MQGKRKYKSQADFKRVNLKYKENALKLFSKVKKLKRSPVRPFPPEAFIKYRNCSPNFKAQINKNKIDVTNAMSKITTE